MPIINLVYEAPRSWSPGSNTIIYFPFKQDAKDYSGNGYTLSTSWTQETIGRRFNTDVTFNETWDKQWKFVSFWIKIYNKGSWWSNVENQMWWWDYGWICYQAYNYYWSAWWDRIQIFTSSSWASAGKALSTTNNTRYHMAYWYWDWAAVCWVNWTKYTLTTWSIYDPGAESPTHFIINRSTTKWDLALSDVIFETELWTDDQVTEYYNATKGNYWL